MLVAHIQTTELITAVRMIIKYNSARFACSYFMVDAFSQCVCVCSIIRFANHDKIITKQRKTIQTLNATDTTATKREREKKWNDNNYLCKLCRRWHKQFCFCCSMYTLSYPMPCLTAWLKNSQFMQMKRLIFVVKIGRSETHMCVDPSKLPRSRQKKNPIVNSVSLKYC